jgi:hypothetical protein
MALASSPAGSGWVSPPKSRCIAGRDSRAFAICHCPFAAPPLCVLLGEKQRLLVGIGCQAASGGALAVSQREDSRILFSASHKSSDQILVRTHGSLGLFGRRSHAGITPIDPMVVAAGSKDWLLLGSYSQPRQVTRRLASPLDLLSGIVHHKLRAGAVIECHGMAFSVHRTQRPSDKSRWQRRCLQVVGQRGGHESAGDMDVSVVKIVDGEDRFNL